MTKVYDCLSHDFVYHDLSKMLIFPGNHDTDRIGDVLRHNPDRHKIVMTLLATMRGIPQIFAGDEMMFVSRTDLRDMEASALISLEDGPATPFDFFFRRRPCGCCREYGRETCSTGPDSGPS